MNPKAYTSKEMSKRLAEAGLFQDKPEAWWFYGELEDRVDQFEEVAAIIAVPLWRLMEELPSHIEISKELFAEHGLAWMVYCNNIGIIAEDVFLPDALALAHLKLAERKTK